MPRRAGSAFDTVVPPPAGLGLAGAEAAAPTTSPSSAGPRRNLPDLRRYVTTKQVLLPRGTAGNRRARRAFLINNHNRLLYCSTIGVKNGYTLAAKQTFIGAVLPRRPHLPVHGDGGHQREPGVPRLPCWDWATAPGGAGAGLAPAGQRAAVAEPGSAQPAPRLPFPSGAGAGPPPRRRQRSRRGRHPGAPSAQGAGPRPRRDRCGPAAPDSPTAALMGLLLARRRAVVRRAAGGSPPQISSFCLICPFFPAHRLVVRSDLDRRETRVLLLNDTLRPRCARPAGSRSGTVRRQLPPGTIPGPLTVAARSDPRSPGRHLVRDAWCAVPRGLCSVERPRPQRSRRRPPATPPIRVSAAIAPVAPSTAPAAARRPRGQRSGSENSVAVMGIPGVAGRRSPGCGAGGPDVVGDAAESVSRAIRLELAQQPDYSAIEASTGWMSCR